jgi:hypothetical protein
MKRTKNVAPTRTLGVRHIAAWLLNSIIILTATSAMALGPQDLLPLVTPNTQIPNDHTEMDQRELQMRRNQDDHGTKEFKPAYQTMMEEVDRRRQQMDRAAGYTDGHPVTTVDDGAARRTDGHPVTTIDDHTGGRTDGHPVTSVDDPNEKDRYTACISSHPFDHHAALNCESNGNYRNVK